MNPEQFGLPVDLTKVRLEKLHDQVLSTRNLSATLARFDLIHPVISGNKWFKLSCHLEKALSLGKSGVITCGGAYSNHIVATAAAGYFAGLSTIGVIGGEACSPLSPTLAEASSFGMQLFYASRTAFRDQANLEREYQQLHPDYFWVPEGGCSPLGIQGAATMLDHIPFEPFTHICCAAGTGTMMAGILQKAQAHQWVFGFPVLRIPDTANNSLEQLLSSQSSAANWKLLYGYHEGGYARSSEALTGFMNQFYRNSGIPTDFVYTGKLLKAVFELAAAGFFPEKSKLLLIHSGGLQGNRGLPEGTLCY